MARWATPERETGVRQLVTRVAETVRDWGIAGGYFASASDAATFHDELAHMLLTQKVAFNSPVWFNVGCDRLEPNSAGPNWHWDPATGGVTSCSDRLPEPAVLGLLHQLGRRLAGVDSGRWRRPRACSSSGARAPARTSARCGRSRRLFPAAERRQRPAQLHARTRCLRRRDQERRQDAARRQDGDPERRPSGHRGLHRVQGEGRGKGLHADSCRL